MIRPSSAATTHWSGKRRFEKIGFSIFAIAMVSNFRYMYGMKSDKTISAGVVHYPSYWDLFRPNVKAKSGIFAQFSIFYYMNRLLLGTLWSLGIPLPDSTYSHYPFQTSYGQSKKMSYCILGGIRKGPSNGGKFKFTF